MTVSQRMVEAIARAIVDQATAEVETLTASLTELIRRRQPRAVVRTIIRDDAGRMVALIDEYVDEYAVDEPVTREEPNP
jgi:hypothetical protein